jgi:hypothetical protein
MLQLHIGNVLLTALLPFFAVASTSAVTPDPKLLSLVPPIAQIVAGMNAPSVSGQADSFLLITYNNTVDLRDFFALSGVDDLRVIQQIMMVAAEDRTSSLAEHSLLASGRFDQRRIFKAAAQNGATFNDFKGIRVLVVPPFGRDHATFREVRWLAVIDSSIALFGTIASVQRELDRHLAHSPADPSLMGKLARLRRDDDTWCVLTANTQSAEIRNALWALDPKLADVIESGDAFQFGVRYGRHIEFEYEVNTASSADAQTLSNSLAQSLGGPQGKGSPLLPAPDLAKGGGAEHGVVRVSRAQYDAWLAAVRARNRARSVADLSRR